MSIPHALLLGIVQGISEFLPISSSGHLALLSALLNIEETPILFSVFLHIATLFAVLIVFRKRIASLILSFFTLVRSALGKASAKPGTRREELAAIEGDIRLILALIVATALTAVIGFLIKGFAESIPPAVVSFLFVVTGVLLILSGRVKEEGATENLSARQAVVVGLAQGVAVLPGLSRSGTTISAALFAGVKRSSAGEFSFLLSIPAILGAFVLELRDATLLAESVPAPALIAGMASAFASGLFSMKLLLGLINRGKLALFAFYLIPAGLVFAALFFLA